MKAQFKFAFRTGLGLRLAGVSITVALTLAALILNFAGAPQGALTTVMVLADIGFSAIIILSLIADVNFCNYLFKAPGGYLLALTPPPRWKTLLCGVLTMFILDVAALLCGLACIVPMNMAEYVNGEKVSTYISSGAWWGTALLMALYLLVLVIAMFSSAVSRSLLRGKRFTGLLGLLTACVTGYAVSLTQLILAPFGAVTVTGTRMLFITVSLGAWGYPLTIILVLANAAWLFLATARLMERKMDI